MTALTTTLSEGDLSRLLAFHGHLCPGALMAARQGKAAAAMLRTLAGEGDGRPFAFYRGGSCPVDGVQLFTGCTWGNANLVLMRGRNFELILTREGGDRGVLVRPLPELLKEMRGGVEGELITSPLGRKLSRGPLEELFHLDTVPVDPALSAWPGGDA